MTFMKESEAKPVLDLTNPGALRAHIEILEAKEVMLVEALGDIDTDLEHARIALLVAENQIATPEALRENLQHRFDLDEIDLENASMAADSLIHEAREAPAILHSTYAEHIGMLAIKFHLHTHDSEDDLRGGGDEDEPSN